MAKMNLHDVEELLQADMEDQIAAPDLVFVPHVVEDDPVVSEQIDYWDMIDQANDEFLFRHEYVNGQFVQREE